MSTILSFLSGRQITNNSGVPQVGARIYHYRENTTTPLTVWTDDAASVAHATPYVTCDAGGFVPLIYVDDTFDWKVIVKTSADVTLQTYDNLPKAVTAASSAAFAPPLLEWTQVTSSASPVALTVNDVGNAYEADTTSGSIEFDLPDAASVGNGKGFVFKKTASANSLIIDPNGSQTIDDSATSLTITVIQTAVGIFSNGAEWYKAFEIAAPITLPTIQRFTTGSGTYTPAAGTRYIRVRMVGGGGGGGAATTNNGAVGGDTSFATWTAIHGNGGVQNSAARSAGGTGGTNGTGTLLARFDGQGGTGQYAGTIAGCGGNSVFGGGGTGSTALAGEAGKTNTGSGGSGGSAAGNSGAGGGAGEYVEFMMTAAQIGASLSYAVGAGGAGGSAGGAAGGNGAAGYIVVQEYY